MDVLVIGAAGLDVKGRVTGPLQMGTSNPGRIRRSPGGVARNIAENLARLGVEVTFISAVGEDWTGHHILQQTQQAGVDVRHVLVRPDLHTGTYLALQDQERQLIVGLDDMAGLEAITPRYLNDRRRLFRDARMVVVDANLSPATLQTVFRLADQYGRPVCADPTSTVLAARLRPFLDQLHLATPNLEEAGALLGEMGAGSAPISMARRLVAEGGDLAVVTLAEEGLCYATAEESGHLPAITAPIVDRTGVGDALTAAVIFGLLEGLPPSEAVRLGLSAAALTLQCQETVCPGLSLERLYGQLVV
ncbi:MAG TPA: ribokinase [Anaerolineales bacterium]|nr:ribokinase [Anaerolineales bacterium]